MVSEDGEYLKAINKTHKFSKKASCDRYLNTVLQSNLDMLSLHGKCENISSIWIFVTCPLFQQTSQLC